MAQRPPLYPRSETPMGQREVDSQRDFETTLVDSGGGKPEFTARDIIEVTDQAMRLETSASRTRLTHFWARRRSYRPWFRREFVIWSAIRRRRLFFAVGRWSSPLDRMGLVHFLLGKMNRRLTVARGFLTRLRRTLRTLSWSKIKGGFNLSGGLQRILPVGLALSTTVSYQAVDPSSHSRL